MGANLRLPNINGLSEKEQILQIKNYLYQLVGELQFALNGSNAGSNDVVIQSGQNSGYYSPSDINAQSAFSVLKPLIIKSADIVNAYYETIGKKLSGEYVAQSEFGTYKQETEQTLSGNSTLIEQAFTNIQTIDTDLQGVFADVEAVDTKLTSEVSGIKQNVENTARALSDSMSETESKLKENIDEVSEDLGSQIKAIAKSVDAILTVNAYIKSGLLYYNDEEFPVYGVEVGQSNNVNGADVFKKFARFTADRLSFYDQNDTEVAYISDYKLYITSVEILYNLIGGGFILDLSRGWTLKYAGGE